MADRDQITVSVVRVQGSAPRDVGTIMRVDAQGQDGTIGGGALEYEAAAIAREMLAGDAQHMHRVMPLGPDLGQCCGGTVTLHFDRGAVDAKLTAPPLWIWGGGHVGRAIAQVMAPFQDRAITVVDTTADRMPDDLPRAVSPLVAADPLRVVGLAPADADHLILTYSHDIDLALCDALLRRDFGSVGLIGSDTKWARFRKRLHGMGHGVEQVARIACPIGDPSLGKHPQAIALGVATAMLTEHRVKEERTG
ncbi:xanthine dehydrogenase accessory protein XdhC [Loktanella sp. F6476L]|uniref:xanthine dehydrogenase accessory protein XdhC n=1 Tax=Loktanella sp. F6476L TaxID=2926405 RepID=UPI001FF222F0|nr:xanthine dehydrogenase accessory protein XdhC [Loktanella sp. F6476L]MCK0120314.1 xanthine dehydrogenase accessory protein XdhC [Loktanella sp. F6476L]